MIIEPHTPQLEGFFETPVDALKVSILALKSADVWLARLKSQLNYTYFRLNRCFVNGSEKISKIGMNTSL